MSTHTPGPWRQYGTSVRAADNGATIATVEANYGDSHATFGSVEDINHSEQVANTRLIAAAPELLEAICKFIAYEKAMDGQDDVQGMLLYAEFSAMAHSAVAKATGQ